VPRLVYYSADLRAMVMDEVPGRPLTEVLRGRRAEPMAEVGRALAELHATPTVPGRAWSFEHEHRELRRHMRGVARALPAQAARLNRLVDGLGASRPGGAAGYAPIHGNLFGDQILYDAKAEPGRRVGIVDWDSWSHGDPHYDLGRLVAHLIFVRRSQGFPGGEGAAVEALLNGYRSVAGADAIDPQRLHWQIATALLLRVKISSVRKLVPGWTRHVGLALREAERYLGGGFRVPSSSPIVRAVVGRPSP
jgi:aminoglycoside phosphotransferase (APT) family kinase protein